MSNGRAGVSACSRWLSTTWKMSPALMYSLHFSTAASKPPGPKFDSIRSVDVRRPGQCRSAADRPRPVAAVPPGGPRASTGVVGNCARRSPWSTWAWATDRDRLVDVVEDDHAVVEGEAQVGQLAVVERRVRQALDIANGVVAGVADRAAGEARQARQGRGAVGGQLSPGAASAGRRAPVPRSGRCRCRARTVWIARGGRTPGSAGTGRSRGSCSGRAVRRRRRSRTGRPSRPPGSCRRR